jgi:uncharacterized protein (DUF2235 family)
MKRIVICADGTWNIRDQVDKKTNKRHPTNVTKVARAVRPRAVNGIDQIVYYHDGVGTAGGLDRFTGGAFGDGIEANIRELYRFLVYNFEPNDEIYLFGFSRGAFTVRTLAGFMNKVGLIQKDDDYFVPDLYDCYEQSKGPGTPEWALAFRHINDPRPCPPIRFIGVWDTVGALGAPGFMGQLLNKNKYQYHDVSLNPLIANAFHALAIDEQRKPFMPNIWTRPTGWAGHLEQAWFAGVHSNVGLEFDETYLHFFTPCFNSVLQDSMTPMYKALGAYIRPIGDHLADGESIHQSAVDRRKLADCNYQAANLGAFLSKTNPIPLAGTTRVPTGVPCPPAV